MSWKRSLLFRSETLGLFGKMLTADQMYSLHYLREISGMCGNLII